jgi:DNA-binding PadR family transcriptional regulator
VEGRGRPRRMYQIRPECLEQAHDLARLWDEYTMRDSQAM